MSKYSMELRFVCDLFDRETVESWFKDYELEDFLTADEIAVINNRGTWNKDKLAKLIVDHYFMNEIGFETPALFRHMAKVSMLEIMEEKLPLIYSAAIKYDPMVNVDYTETYEHESETSSESSTSGLAVNSDTPQGQINKQAILGGSYASSTGANENVANDSTTGNDNYTKRIKGNSGVSATAQKMVEQYRENIVAINRDIVEELNKLFMAVY